VPSGGRAVPPVVEPSLRWSSLSRLWLHGPMSYSAADDRYDSMPYRYAGRSGLKLPMLSLGLWQNFGDDRDEDTQRAILRRAFDRGVTHFDLANNYGPPYGRAEENFGRYLE